MQIIPNSSALPILIAKEGPSEAERQEMISAANASGSWWTAVPSFAFKVALLYFFGTFQSNAKRMLCSSRVHQFPLNDDEFNEVMTIGNAVKEELLGINRAHAELLNAMLESDSSHFNLLDDSVISVINNLKLGFTPRISIRDSKNSDITKLSCLILSLPLAPNRRMVRSCISTVELTRLELINPASRLPTGREAVSISIADRLSIPSAPFARRVAKTRAFGALCMLLYMARFLPSESIEKFATSALRVGGLASSFVSLFSPNVLEDLGQINQETSLSKMFFSNFNKPRVVKDALVDCFFNTVAGICIPELRSDFAGLSCALIASVDIYKFFPIQSIFGFMSCAYLIDHYLVRQTKALQLPTLSMTNIFESLIIMGAVGSIYAMASASVFKTFFKDTQKDIVGSLFKSSFPNSAGEPLISQQAPQTASQARAEEEVRRRYQSSNSDRGR